MGAYWAGTSGNDIIHQLLENENDNLRNDIMELGSGGTVISDLDERVVYLGLGLKREIFFSVMAMAGYLKAVRCDSGYMLSIPNREMYSVYFDAIDLGDDGMIKMQIKGLVRAMKAGDADAISASLSDLMMDALSSKILDREHSYQTFLIGLLMAFCGEYRIYGDTLETGSGFADVVFEKKHPSDVNIIVEMKRSVSSDNLEKDARSALEQIRKNDYAHNMSGTTLLYGMAFYKKKTFTLTEKSEWADDDGPRSVRESIPHSTS